MSKKINAILTVLLIATLLLVGLVSCGASRVDYFDYSASNMGWVGNLVLLMHKWIGNYGWTVVVFTLFLKLLMLPIDFWQRYAARKSSVKMKQMQPLVDEIDKRFGANTPRANEEKQKLYKKQGFNMLSSCLPMILSMVIFFVMFGGLNNYSTYSSIESYKTLSNTYYVTMENQFLAMNTDKVEGDKTIAQIYQEEYETRYASRKAYLEKENENKKLSEEAIEQNAELYGRINASNKVRNLLDNNGFASTNKVAIDAVKETYLDQQESWLWIKNVWQPDTWAPVMPKYKDFQGKINMELYPDENSGETTY
ncbi:MAG: YidC/Oxa1 family membrane protein insertase, partial [Clostridia bacterium]|nr:YidC/Oxa1 family membrane protein insertase [Clostridia bacterium]